MQATLAAKTPGDRRVIVATDAGYQAATYAAIGNVNFWQALSPGTTWQHVGEQIYPYDKSLDPSGPTSANAAVLANMTDATFILRGTFSTDGGRNAIAYTRGADGWGVIVARADGSLAPSSDPSYNGPSYGLSLVGGNLQTQDCPPNLPMYKCGDANVVVKHWHWDGSKFVRV
ncbi:MAG: hypothetical protein DLM57_00880 [Pseudonocardiales bacterium]|nr:MAG: hypothetical protein DLM57_00880 [Pseudonocardiales bacterium]